MLVRRGPLQKRKPLPAGIRAKLAKATFRAARSAAKNGRCALAEMLLAFGGVDLHASAARARRIGPAIKVLDAGQEGADAGVAIIECRARERSGEGPAATGVSASTARQN
jgi:hypothetical protein